MLAELDKAIEEMQATAAKLSELCRSIEINDATYVLYNRLSSAASSADFTATFLINTRAELLQLRARNLVKL